MTKQSLGFLVHEGFERLGQLEMNAGDDDFVMILAVHISAYGLGCTRASEHTGPEENFCAARVLAKRSPLSLLFRRYYGRIFRYWKIIHRAVRETETGTDVLQPLSSRAAHKIF